MNKFIMLVGLSGSGKSTYARTLKEDFLCVSSDNIRKEFFGDVNDQTHNSEVFEMAHTQIICALENEKNVLFDATNLSAKKRKAFLNRIKYIKCKKEVIVFATPYFTCIARDALRKRTVGRQVILNQMKKFEMPHQREGWDSIEIKFDENCKMCSLIPYLDNFTPHDSPYHFEGVEEHMLMCADLARNDKRKQYLIDALSFHDIGKLYTKVFTNAKGEPSEIAHYYGHENVSAYMYLTSTEFCGLDALYLIQYHMEPYKRKNKAWEKFSKDFSIEFISTLMLMHRYDEIGRRLEE